MEMSDILKTADNKESIDVDNEESIAVDNEESKAVDNEESIAVDNEKSIAVDNEESIAVDNISIVPTVSNCSFHDNTKNATADQKTSRIGGRRIKAYAKKLVPRAVMMLHSVLAAWRVVVSRGDARFWALAAGNAIWAADIIVVVTNFSVGKQRWRPSFVLYLLLLLPAIWLLQLHQNDVTQSKVPTQNSTSSGGSLLDSILSIENTTWIVLIQETLIYVLLLGRWLNDEVPGELLSQQLISFLASASDIMELYALFDLPVVQKHFATTVAVLAIWSASFIQFIPVLTKTKQASKQRQNNVVPSLQSSEAEASQTSEQSSRSFDIAEVVLSFVFQDGPFLVIRLFIIINFNTITYSLVFFLIKNIVTSILLLYRLVVLFNVRPSKIGQWFHIFDNGQSCCFTFIKT